MFMDAVKEDVEMVGVPEQEARGRVRWRQSIRCVDPWSEQPEEQEEEKEESKTLDRRKTGSSFFFSTLGKNDCNTFWGQLHRAVAQCQFKT